MPFQDTSGSVNIFLTIYRFFILLLFAAFLAIAAKLARPKSSVFHTQRCHSVGIGLNRECFTQFRNTDIEPGHDPDAATS